MMNLKIILADRNKEMVEKWKKYCADLPCVAIYDCSANDVTKNYGEKYQAVVNPDNSYSFLDAGISSYYCQRDCFGPKIQERLHWVVKEQFYGEMLVGQAAIIPTDHPQIPYLITAPTMRVSMMLDKKTINPYLAMRGILLLVKHGSFPEAINGEPCLNGGKKIAEIVKCIAVPGLATGVGGVDPDLCARQQRDAINDFVLGEYSFPADSKYAEDRHQMLYLQSKQDLRNLHEPEE